MGEFDLGGLSGPLSEHFQAARHQFCRSETHNTSYTARHPNIYAPVCTCLVSIWYYPILTIAIRIIQLALGIHTVVPVPMKQPWKIWVNVSMNSQQKPQQTRHIFHGLYCVSSTRSLQHFLGMRCEINMHNDGSWIDYQLCPWLRTMGCHIMVQCDCLAAMPDNEIQCNNFIYYADA